MKSILCLDTSDRFLSVGLFSDGKEVARISYEAWQRQSESLVQEIHSLLSEQGISPKALAGVSVSKGPGSYTGVRIALSVAKTLAFSLQIPLYLSSSLEVLRQKEGVSICLCNARGKRSYFAVYDQDKALVEDCIKDNAEVLAYMQDHPDYAVCGDVSYLGLESKPSDVLAILAQDADESHRIENVHAARPVYLKDDYDKDRLRTVVRKAMIADLPAILEIGKNSLHSTYTDKDILYDMQENPLAYFYSALVDGEVVGYLDFYVTFNSATIVQIAVKEEYRKKGIGNLLLGAMLRECEAQGDPVEYITLEVRSSNLNAQRFYKKHKFEAVTTKRAYYDDGEDAIYMVRTLIHG